MDNNLPLVSVVMPVYKAEMYLKEAIESILKQTYTNFEFLIFNDGSTDNSLKIIESYSELDKRIVLAYQGENKGYVHHLNEAIKIANGKYIVRMDADDIAHPERIEKQVKFLEKNSEYVLCGSRVQCIGNSNEIVTLPIEDEEIRLKMLYINPFAHPSVTIRKSVLIENKLFYNEIAMPAEDYDLWTKIIAKGKVHNLPEILLKYRVHQKNISLLPKTQSQIEANKQSNKNYIVQFFQKNHLNDEELELMYCLFNSHQIEFSLKEIKKIAHLIKKIIFLDCDYHMVRKEKVEELLIYRFFYICTTSTYLGIPLWWFYIRSGLTYSNLSLNIKFFVKSFLKFKNE